MKDEVKHLDIPFDTELAGQLESKVDLCAFKTVKSHFRNPESEIFQVIIVQGDYLLHEVAALFENPPEEKEGKEEEFLDELFEAEVIQAGVDDLEVAWSDYRKYAVLLDTIEDNRLCYVIYSPPAYFVKLTDKKWL